MESFDRIFIFDFCSLFYFQIIGERVGLEIFGIGKGVTKKAGIINYDARLF